MSFVKSDIQHRIAVLSSHAWPFVSRLDKPLAAQPLRWES